MKREIIRYMDNNDAGKPYATLKEISDDLFEDVKDRINHDPALTPFKAKGLKKVRITLTLEYIKD